MLSCFATICSVRRFSCSLKPKRLANGQHPHSWIHTRQMPLAAHTRKPKQGVFKERQELCSYCGKRGHGRSAPAGRCNAQLMTKDADIVIGNTIWKAFAAARTNHDMYNLLLPLTTKVLSLILYAPSTLCSSHGHGVD